MTTSEVEAPESPDDYALVQINQAFVDNRGPMTTEELAKALGVSYKTMRRRLNKFVAAGEIKRAGYRTGGGRPRELFFTGSDFDETAFDKDVISFRWKMGNNAQIWGLASLIEAVAKFERRRFKASGLLSYILVKSWQELEYGDEGMPEADYLRGTSAITEQNWQVEKIRNLGEAYVAIGKFLIDFANRASIWKGEQRQPGYIWKHSGYGSEARGPLRMRSTSLRDASYLDSDDELNRLFNLLEDEG